MKKAGSWLYIYINELRVGKIRIDFIYCCDKHTDKTMTFHGYMQEDRTEQLISNKIERKYSRHQNLTWFDPKWSTSTQVL